MRAGFASAAAAGNSFRAPETQIFDYRSNQYTLLKWLANAYAQRFVANWTTAKMDGMMGARNPCMLRASGMSLRCPTFICEHAGGDAAALEELPELHATAAGLKGYCCNATSIGIEECRKCCGGAGYLLASGIAPLEADFKWRATAEGARIDIIENAGQITVMHDFLPKLAATPPPSSSY